MEEQIATDVENQDVYALDFSYPFLENIDPHHLPRTITIPQKYWDAMANMERQYWEIKSQRYNVMIFFKKGAFYEFYDSDAVIAAREFGLKMVFDTTNRGKMRLAGVPEHSYNEWARLFVYRGYKVGRVEQMKVPADTKVKVIPRELVEVLTPGTITDPSMLSDHREVFVLTLVPCFDSARKCVGIDAFAVDLSRRVVLWCPCVVKQQDVNTDDATGSQSHIPDEALRTVTALLHHLQPREVILPEATDTAAFSKSVDSIAKWVEGESYNVDYFPLLPGSSTTMAENPAASVAQGLMENYFRNLSLEKHIPLFSEATLYTAHTAASVTKQNVDRSFDGASAKAMPILTFERKYDSGLILDASTISNLEIVANLQDGTEKHSLHAFLHCCETNGGKRLFRSWLLRPSASARVIKCRQDVVRFIVDQNLLEEWNPRKSAILTQSSDMSSRKRSRDSDDPSGSIAYFSTVDFERVLSRLADLKDESSNVSFVDPLVQYKRNLDVIIKTVKSFSDMVVWADQFEQKCQQYCHGTQVIPPLLTELIANIKAATNSVSTVKHLFDAEAAEANGLLIPTHGTSPDYDKSEAAVRTLEHKLHAERMRLSGTLFDGAQVQFTEIGHDIFLLEVDVHDAPKMTPRGLTERNRTSKVVRYVASTMEKMVEDYKKATAEKSAALLSVLRSVASRMCQEAVPFFNASQALAYLDCLMALADITQRHANVCLPTIVDSEEMKSATLNCEELVHPLLLSRNPVPNTVRLDGPSGRLLVLTGPNMAGKSTIMRTVAINVIMAQLGGPIFGNAMTIAPLDRIFTRIGARDASHKGQSTLYVELSETADILRYATARSLCLIDELGRGTSTHDGMAIAHATLEAIKQISPAPPLTLFSTHYHALAMEQARQRPVEEKQHGASGVQLGYMDFSLTKQEETGLPSVTFLYRLVAGICDRSYGVEVALMAGIAPSLVQLAKEKSDELLRKTALHEDVRLLEKLVMS